MSERVITNKQGLEAPRTISPELRELWDTQDKLAELNRKYRARVLADAQSSKVVLKKQAVQDRLHGEKRYADWKTFD